MNDTSSARQRARRPGHRARVQTRRRERAARHEQLFDAASQQAGYFTRHQARACGFSDALLLHHARQGTFVKVRRGLYRFRQFPSSPREQVMAAWLTVGPAGVVVSHETALELLGLSDVIPDRVHLLVPRTRRGRRPPAGVALHTTLVPIRKQDVVIRDGIPITAPPRAIVDSAAAGVAPDQIETAVKQAVDRALTSPAELRRAAAQRGGFVRTLIDHGLAAARAT